MAIALTDQGLAYLLIAATAIHPDQRDAWLQKIAAQHDPSPQSPQLRYYHRVHNKRAMLHIVVEVGPVADFLIDQGFLAEWDSEDLDAINRAAEKAFREWPKY